MFSYEIISLNLKYIYIYISACPESTLFKLMGERANETFGFGRYNSTTGVGLNGPGFFSQEGDSLLLRMSSKHLRK